MSRADELFIRNCRDILDSGVWDTDLQVRPHWEDGAPAYTIKKFGVVNRYDLAKEFPILTLRRTLLRAQRTRFCGYGSKNPIIFMICTVISGMSGRTRTALSARPTAISWA